MLVSVQYLVISFSIYIVPLAMTMDSYWMKHAFTFLGNHRVDICFHISQGLLSWYTTLRSYIYIYNLIIYVYSISIYCVISIKDFITVHYWILLLISLSVAVELFGGHLVKFLVTRSTTEDLCYLELVITMHGHHWPVQGCSMAGLSIIIISEGPAY